MIKYIGGALLIVLGWIVGQSIFFIYKDRVSLLERFSRFVSFTESEISFFRTELSTIIDKFKEKDNRYDEMIFTENKKSFVKNKMITETINGFFDQMTRLDAENQKYFFSETKNNISQWLEKGKKDVEIKGQMAKKLLPILALGIFILLL